MRSFNSLLGRRQFAVRLRRFPCSAAGKSAGQSASSLSGLKKSDGPRCRAEKIPCWQGISLRRDTRNRPTAEGGKLLTGPGQSSAQRVAASAGGRSPVNSKGRAVAVIFPLPFANAVESRSKYFPASSLLGPTLSNNRFSEAMTVINCPPGASGNVQQPCRGGWPSTKRLRPNRNAIGLYLLGNRCTTSPDGSPVPRT